MDRVPGLVWTKVGIHCGLLVGALALFCIVAQAQSPAPADAEAADDEQLVQEVFQTELVYTQDKGEVQLTFSPTFTAGRGFDTVDLAGGVEYGITDRWQVSVNWAPFTRRHTRAVAVRGVGDVELGTQYSFLHIHDSDWHAALGLEVGIPAGDVNKDLTEGLLEFEPYVAVARDLPKLGRAQLFGQVGVGLVRRVKTPRPPTGGDDAGDEVDGDDDTEDLGPAAHELTLSGGFFVPIRSLRYTTEVTWTTNKWNRGGDESEVYATPGLVLVLPHHWEVGVGVPLGLTHDADRRRVTFNLIYEFDTRRSDEEARR